MNFMKRRIGTDEDHRTQISYVDNNSGSSKVDSSASGKNSRKIHEPLELARGYEYDTKVDITKLVPDSDDDPGGPEGFRSSFMRAAKTADLQLMVLQYIRYTKNKYLITHYDRCLRG